MVRFRIRNKKVKQFAHCDSVSLLFCIAVDCSPLNQYEWDIRVLESVQREAMKVVKGLEEKSQEESQCPAWRRLWTDLSEVITSSWGEEEGQAMTSALW